MRSTVLATGSVLDPLYSAMGAVLAWFYSVIPSYGVAIILLTIAVRLLLFPLTTKQARSMQAMQKLQPEIKRLQAKYKADRQKLNEEMMKFYKENKVNPLAGCLPLVLQMPLFIVLYRLVNDLTPHAHGRTGKVLAPKHIPRSSELYQALVTSGGKMVSWGIDLAQRAGSVGGLGRAWPYYLLVGLVIGTGYYQQRQMTARNPSANANPQTQMIGKVFPVVFGVISLSIPAGVVVYFITSNLWQIGQQAWIFRQRDASAGGNDGTAEPSPKPPKPAKPAKPAKPEQRPGNGSGSKPAGKPARDKSNRKPKKGK